MKCQICERIVDNLGEIEFEAGNNAEVGVMLKACDQCGEEASEDYSAFQTKHADTIEKYASEKLADAMDYYSDRP